MMIAQKYVQANMLCIEKIYRSSVQNYHSKKVLAIKGTHAYSHNLEV